MGLGALEAALGSNWTQQDGGKGKMEGVGNVSKSCLAVIQAVELSSLSFKSRRPGKLVRPPGPPCWREEHLGVEEGEKEKPVRACRKAGEL